MPKSTRRAALFVLVLFFSMCFIKHVRAQNVVRKGNTFVEQRDSSSKRNGATKTVYTYTDSKGQVDTIYLSSTGSAFVWKTSKKTGKKYRKYLPKVTEALGTKKTKK